MKLDIQRFGGRGATSGGNSIGGSFLGEEKGGAKVESVSGNIRLFAGDKVTRTYDGKVRLQSVGEVDARKASNLKVGDIIMYNFGSTAKVTKIEPSKSGKSFTVYTTSSDSGYKGQRKYNGNTLLGIAEQEAKTYADQLKLRFTRGKK